MTRTSRRRRRPQGGIEELPSGSLRVYAYSNIDPLSGKKHYLRELIPAGTPNAEKEAPAVALTSEREAGPLHIHWSMIAPALVVLP